MKSDVCWVLLFEKVSHFQIRRPSSSGIEKKKKIQEISKNHSDNNSNWISQINFKFQTFLLLCYVHMLIKYCIQKIRHVAQWNTLHCTLNTCDNVLSPIRKTKTPSFSQKNFENLIEFLFKNASESVWEYRNSACPGHRDGPHTTKNCTFPNAAKFINAS